MRILLVTGIFPPDSGGPASYVPTIAEALRGRGHTITAVVTQSDTAHHDDTVFGFPVVRISRKMGRLRRVSTVIRVVQRLARRSDVVYLNGLVTEGLIASKVLGRKTVVVKVVGDKIWEQAQNLGVYDGTIDDFQTASLPATWRAFRWAYRFQLRLADGILAPSDYLRRIVHRWGVKKNVRVIYNALHSVCPPNRSPAAPAYDVVTVARLVPWKGIAELIHLAKGTGWRLKIVGDGPMLSELQTLALNSPGTGIVDFIGRVEQRRIAEEISSAKVFVLNSSYEGLPHIVLEAKAAGVPVVATAAGGTPEVVTDDVDGCLVPVGDAASLRERISLLLSDERMRQRLVESARTQLAMKFSFDVMVDQTEAMLRDARAIST